MECFWIRNTDRTIGRLRAASKRTALIPLASIESHGPHLPLGSDPITIDYVVGQVVHRETVAVLPTIYYAFVEEARALPGAIHMRSDIQLAHMEQICDEVHRNGFTKIILLHGHGGNAALHGTFAKRVLERCKPYMIYSIPVFAGRGAAITALATTQPLGHACEMETSFNMAVCPELVDLKALGKRTFPTQQAPDVKAAATSVDWIARYPNMAVGHPRAATAAKGRKMLAVWIDGIVDHVRRIKRDKIGPAVLRDYIRRCNSIK